MKFMRIDKDYILGLVIGIIPIIFIRTIFSKNEVLYIMSLKYYTCLANSALTFIQIMEIWGKLKYLFGLRKTKNIHTLMAQ